ncbi:MAG: hypothetical protein NC041_10300 [Bacteroides sp.]|nr:hypothetical protein [Prevotella sp.]MCM1408895.1 hypothetical protein [Treponema brennaborense]MCM1470844.1 hypothetical protein [Bacteroides sp.]
MAQKDFRVMPFSFRDIMPAADIAFGCWHTELAGHTEKFKRFIYKSLVRYYFRNPRFSFSNKKDRRAAGNHSAADELSADAGARFRMLASFLLGACKTDAAAADDFLNPPASFSPRERTAAKDYHSYLETNGRRMKQLMREDDAYIGLFAGCVPATGSVLRKTFENACAENNIRRVFLWTDETCNIDYYHKNGFFVAADFPSEFCVNGNRLKTLVFQKNLDDSV